MLVELNQEFSDNVIFKLEEMLVNVVGIDQRLSLILVECVKKPR